MKKAVSALMVVFSILVLAGITLASEAKMSKQPVQKPAGFVADAVTVEATVNAVDTANRSVTLQGTNGFERTIKVGPDVKNFDQIKVGDKVTARFMESVAVLVAKKGEKPAVTEFQTVEVAPKGEKPGVVLVDTVEVTAVVEKIDYKKRSISLKGPQGNVREFIIDKSVNNFKNIKKGDDVYLLFTEAVAITVDKPMVNK